MNKKYPFGSNSGVTLIELLVVMLIVVILAISLLPTFQKYTINASYTVDAVPIAADMRLQTELFRYERGGGLPGLSTFDTDPVNFLNSSTAADAYTQTWVFTGTNSAGVPQYATASRVYGNAAAIQTNLPTIYSTLRYSALELTGRRMTPTDVQYQGFAGTNGYMYAAGAFGGGEQSKLVPGSGFATIEIVNQAANVNLKIVGEWKRYEEGTVAPGLSQVQLVSAADGYAFTTVDQYILDGVCYMGNPSQLLGDDPDTVSVAIEELRSAGWAFNLD